ncbi:MAG: DUF3644 domain-containing protein [Planctomycetes bacterium]|nr:DUF3644 domain-containing protein [Planctomycetota bacterium]
MSGKQSFDVRDNLEKCRSAAVAAVEFYNRPGRKFRTAHYLVMIVIAWGGFFHAYFYSKRKKPWHRSRQSGTGRRVRYLKVDGEPKHWDVAECAKQYWGSDNPPIRKNLEFLIGLRNKIEHRHLPDLDCSLYGECQAALMNLEEMLVAEFGRRYALMDELALALQFSQVMPEERKKAARAMATAAVSSVRDYVEVFRAGLPSSTLNSMKYSFSVYLVPRVVNREKAADAAVQFVTIDEASEEELQRLERLNVLIKEKHIPIANLDRLKPSQVVEEVNAKLPFRFTMDTHTRARKKFGIRPAEGATKPEATTAEYCSFDAVHRDYVYTKAWVARLLEELWTEEGYLRVIGRDPVAG